MPDIAMCTGVGCKYKESCYRFVAKPSENRQSYFKEPPIKDLVCIYYSEVKR